VFVHAFSNDLVPAIDVLTALLAFFIYFSIKENTKETITPGGGREKRDNGSTRSYHVSC
jgi:hypothetical protein